MKIPTQPLFWFLGCLTLMSAVDAAEKPPSEQNLFRAVQRGDLTTMRRLLREGMEVNARDQNGGTPLHLAALRGDAAAVALLLSHDAAVDATNNAGATPLLYGAHDLGVVRALLRRGANPNLASTRGQTPLLAAVTCNESYPLVRLLIEHGADVKARKGKEEPALASAIQGGDRRTIELLIDRGATINPTNGFSPLASAAFAGDGVTAQRLLEAGADLNYDAGFAGHSLNWAFYGNHPEMAALLIERGADLRMPSPSGHKTPPMVWSAYNEFGDATLARMLLSRGIDVNCQNDAGESALSWALKRGERTALADLLRNAGGVSTGKPPKRKSVPNHNIPSSRDARLGMTRGSVQRAIDLLQRSSIAFLDNAFVRDRAKCTSCHQQTLPMVAFAWARERGFTLDEPELTRLLDTQARFWKPSVEKARQLDEPQPDAPNNLGWGLQGLHALRYAPDDMTEAMVHYLVSIQRADGCWPSFDRRPPMEDGLIVGAALATRAVRLYPLPEREGDTAKCLQRARRWLAQAEPRTHNERVFQLLGLSWAGESPKRLAPLVRRLIAQQRPDGGWAQLNGLESDAWATGQTLVALHQAGGIPASHAAYQRGVEFLLRTQFEDGSWWVQSRTWPFQPHFDSQFPHGKDQWISAAGTAWAVMALLLTMEPTVHRDALPSAQALLASVADRPATTKVPNTEINLASTAVSLDFGRDIRPIFERSCVDCHSGARPKGGFRMATRDTFLKGGQSGEAAITPGRGNDSPLIRYVSDQVEDLEMPPLPKREKYPSLTKDEIERLRAWIDQGSPWPAGITLGSVRASEK